MKREPGVAVRLGILGCWSAQSRGAAVASSRVDTADGSEEEDGTFGHTIMGTAR